VVRGGKETVHGHKERKESAGGDTQRKGKEVQRGLS